MGGGVRAVMGIACSRAWSTSASTAGRTTAGIPPSATPAGDRGLRAVRERGSTGRQRAPATPRRRDGVLGARFHGLDGLAARADDLQVAAVPQDDAIAVFAQNTAAPFMGIFGAAHCRGEWSGATGL